MVKVKLAGYNVDADVLEKVKNNNYNGEPLTPETTTAAYARISRDPRNVTELREDSVSKVGSARKSNAIIIYGMGHTSIGNHAVFNFDVTNASRRALEKLEEGRYSGYTEKSQRYITLEGDYITPAELGEQDVVKFKNLVENVQNKFYLDNLQKVIDYHFDANPELAKQARDGDKRALETIKGWGKEDARYSLGLSAEAQLGYTPNATNLENIVRKMKHSSITEERELAKLLIDAAMPIAPSLFLYADEAAFEKRFPGRTLEEDFLKYGKSDAKKAVEELIEKQKYDVPNDLLKTEFKKSGDVTLVSCSNIDIANLSALVFNNSKHDIQYSTKSIEKSDPEDLKTFVKDSLKSLSAFDSLGREFEFSGGLTFELTGSSSMYAQLKRHRTMSLLAQAYDINLGLTIPESIKQIGLSPALLEVGEKSNELYSDFKNKYGTEVSEYCLTNAHRRRSLVNFNSRSFHNFIKLREDEHAQWDIRNLAVIMNKIVKEEAPLSHMLTSGKHLFDDTRKNIYG